MSNFTVPRRIVKIVKGRHVKRIRIGISCPPRMYEHPRTIVIISFRSVVSKKSLRPSYDGHTTIESFLFPKKIQEDGSIVTLDYRVVTASNYRTME